jgi:glycosyltransferase involved in cell wall biosynthesis
LPEPFFSICIVTGRRTDLLEACLASLADQQDAPPFELLVAADRDATVAAQVFARFPEAKVAAVEPSFPGAARNVLIDAARGTWLLFLDDDVTFPRGLLRRFADLAALHPEALVLGGPNETPPRSSRFQVVQGAVLSSVVASGPVRRRYGPHPAGTADERWFILCNLAVRRDAMVPFASDLACAEENQMLNELSGRGYPMHYDPKLAVFHERRSTFGGFWRQMRKYGLGRGQLLRRDPSSLRLAFLLPSALLAYLVAAPLAVLATGSMVPAIPLLVYVAGVLAGAARVAVTLRRPSAMAWAMALIPTVHVAYGAGVVAGVVSHTRPRRVRSTPKARWVAMSAEHPRREP